MANEKVTMKLIAEKANVSVGTVDRALNNRGRIDENTKQKVLSTAEYLGYRKNTMASILKKGNIYKIAVLFPKSPDYFVHDFFVGVENAKNDFKEFPIEVCYFHSNHLIADEQIEIMNEIAKEKFNAIVINAAGNKLAEKINEFCKSGTPVATFNSDAPLSNRLFYVGENPYCAGMLAGELMGKLLHGKGKVAYGCGFNYLGAHKERVAGFCSVIRHDYPGITLIQMPECKDDEQKAEQYSRQILYENPDICGMTYVSASGSIGLGRMLKSIQLDDGPRVQMVGFDLNMEMKDYIKKGICTLTIYQNPRMQAYYAMKKMITYLLDYEDISEKVKKVNTEIVLKYNLENYM